MIETMLVVCGYLPEDWEALCGVYERAARGEPAFRPMPEEEDQALFQSLNTVRVACVGEQIVGFVAWRERGEWQGSGYLSWLYVDPALQRRGIGERLLTEAMAALGEQAWTLTGQENTPALTLYQKHGLQPVRHHEGQVRLALPTSRKFDPDVPNFGSG
jgi:ribosomal protein S18 acetylase RimI-like enzyme